MLALGFYAVRNETLLRRVGVEGVESRRGVYDVDHEFEFFVTFYYSTFVMLEYTLATFSGLNEIGPRGVVRSRNGWTVR